MRPHLHTATLMLLFPPAFCRVQGAETQAPAFTIETDFNSRYVYRGIPFSRGPVAQTTASVTISGLTLYTWANLMLGHELHQNQFSEFDFGLSYKKEWRKLAIEPAFDFYWFRSPATAPAVLGVPPTGELSLGASYPIGPVRVFSRHSVDTVSYRGAYFGTAGVSYERTWRRRYTLAGTVTAGWASAKSNNAYAGFHQRGVNITATKVAFTYPLAHGIYLRPHWELTAIPSRQLRTAISSSTVGGFGVAVGVNLSRSR
jgi:hypothetical protein